jgi:hypothetical protein
MQHFSAKTAGTRRGAWSKVVRFRPKPRSRRGDRPDGPASSGHRLSRAPVTKGYCVSRGETLHQLNWNCYPHRPNVGLRSNASWSAGGSRVTCRREPFDPREPLVDPSAWRDGVQSASIPGNASSTWHELIDFTWASVRTRRSLLRENRPERAPSPVPGSGKERRLVPSDRTAPCRC